MRCMRCESHEGVISAAESEVDRQISLSPKLNAKRRQHLLHGLTLSGQSSDTHRVSRNESTVANTHSEPRRSKSGIGLTRPDFGSS